MSQEIAEVNQTGLTKEVLLKVRQLKTKIEEHDRLKHEPIAVIGMGCRFPDRVNSPQEYWQLLEKGIDAISEAPSDRFTKNQKYGGF
ncbi:MAG: hypothetical protein HC763_13365 [Hydrococcus sp. CRU_1_1]|nr:hypothetical protein [Hydrococcus sp. CRU_1_1]